MKSLDELKIEFGIKEDELDSANTIIKSKLANKSNEELFTILTKYVNLIREDISVRGLESPSDIDGYVLVFRLSEPVNNLINLIADSLFISTMGKSPRYGYISKAEKELKVIISVNRNVIRYVTGKFEIEHGLAVDFGF